jgi:hypothetical protein
METNELQDMREQMALLKDTLRKEQIVNDRLMREAMRSKVSSIHRRAWISAACALYVCTFGVWAFRQCGFSWWLTGGTVLIMIYSMIETYRIHRRMATSRVLTEDLRTVALAAKRLKQDYIDWLWKGIALGIAMALGFAVEIIFGNTIFSESSLTARIVLASAMLVSCGIGFIIGYRMHLRVLKLCDDIIRQVEE